MTSWARMCLGNHEGRAQANATVAGRAKAICTRVYNEYRNIDLAPHGGNINEPHEHRQFANGVGILQLDANGQVHVRTTTGNCTVAI